MESSANLSVIRASQSRILVMIFLGLFIGSSCSYTAYACSCARIIELDEELKSAEVIFSGRAIRVDTFIYGKATFEVSRVWRGDIPSFVDTAILYECMSAFHTGEEYLFFGHKIQGENHFAAKLRANGCGQTREIRYSQNALSVLGEGTPPKKNLLLSSIWFIKLHWPLKPMLTLLVISIGLLFVRLFMASKRNNQGAH